MNVVGITLSEEQYNAVKQRIKDEGLEDQGTSVQWTWSFDYITSRYVWTWWKSGEYFNTI